MGWKLIQFQYIWIQNGNMLFEYLFVYWQILPLDNYHWKQDNELHFISLNKQVDILNRRHMHLAICDNDKYIYCQF